MQQFNLSEWLKDKSRKVKTRNNIEVEIIHDSFPLVAIINGVAYNFDNDGKFQSNKTNHKYDLFFADEEEKTIDDTEMNSLAYLTELGYTCIPPNEEQKPAWSEEDEANIDYSSEIIGFLKNYIKTYECTAMNSWVKWLNSFKSQPHWKPTEEQLKALELQIIGRRDALYELFLDLREL